jgi:hypothetical protein
LIDYLVAQVAFSIVNVNDELAMRRGPPGVCSIDHDARGGGLLGGDADSDKKQNDAGA